MYKVCRLQSALGWHVSSQSLVARSLEECQPEKQQISVGHWQSWADNGRRWVTFTTWLFNSLHDALTLPHFYQIGTWKVNVWNWQDVLVESAKLIEAAAESFSKELCVWDWESLQTFFNYQFLNQDILWYPMISSSYFFWMLSLFGLLKRVWAGER